jgi:hypothetical protein
LGEYYFDIETYSPELKPDPLKDKIIAIAYQRLRSMDGFPIEDLQILTEWECGDEKLLLGKFKEVFLTGRDFDFIPIGINLYGFDLISIIQKMNRYFGSNLDFQFLRDRPTLDVKPVLVIMNGGKFGDYQVPLRGKKEDSKIAEWYDAKQYQNIIRYIQVEADRFVRAYQILKKQLPEIRLR